MSLTQLVLLVAAAYNVLVGLSLLGLSLYTLRWRKWGRWMRIVQATMGGLAATVYLAVLLGAPMSTFQVYARLTLAGTLSVLLAWEILMQSLPPLDD